MDMQKLVFLGVDSYARLTMRCAPTHSDLLALTSRHECVQEVSNNLWFVSVGAVFASYRCPRNPQTDEVLLRYSSGSAPHDSAL